MKSTSFFYLFYLFSGFIFTTINAFADELNILADEQRGVIHDFSTANISSDLNSAGQYQPSNRFVVAVRDSNDKLFIIVWQVNSNGSLSFLSSHTTGNTIKRVSVSSVGRNRIVTALRDGEDNLRVIVWDIKDDGRRIVRRGTRTLDRITDVDVGGAADGQVLANLHRRKFVTAARDWDGNLSVSAWKVRANGQIRVPDTKTYGAVTIRTPDASVFGPVNTVDVKTSVDTHFATTVAIVNSTQDFQMISFQGHDSVEVERGGQAVQEFRFNGRHSPTGIAKTSRKSLTGDVYSLFAREAWTVRPARFSWSFHGRLFIDAAPIRLIRWTKEPTGSQTFLTAPFNKKEERFIDGSGEVTAWDGDIEVLDPTGPPGLDGSIVTATVGYGKWSPLPRREQGRKLLNVTTYANAHHSTEEIFDRQSSKKLHGDWKEVEIVEVAKSQFAHRFVTALRGRDDRLRLVVWENRPD